MSLSEDPIIPTNEPPRPTPEELAAQRARRRRTTRRSLIPADADGQAALITSLAKRAFPSIELFVFSLLCGAVMGLGFLLDSQAVVLLGILLAPLMTPWVGLLLAILTGNGRFFFQTLMAMLISVVLVFIGGLLAGFGARPFMPITLTNVFINARLWIPALVVLVVGAVTLVASFVRSEEKPFLPSVIVAYALYLPVNAAAFGLGSGLQDVWPQGLFVFLVHFALASFFGLITLFVLKLKPSPSGLVFGGVAAAVFAGILITLMGPGIPSAMQAADTSTPAVTFTAPPSTPSLSSTSTSTPRPPSTPTLTPTRIDLTETVSVALTQAASTPNPDALTAGPTSAVTATALSVSTTATGEPVSLVAGKIKAPEGGGANLRQTPNGKYLLTLDNGEAVEVLSDFRQVNGSTWIHVYVTRNGQRVEGWLLESVVDYIPPAPNFEPSATPTVEVITPAP
jgi:MFS family permease